MIRTFALVYGILFVVTGIAGFIPAFVTPANTGMEMPASHMGEGLLLGLFPTNAIHNVFHLLWGLWGLLSIGNARRAWIYAAITAAVYILLSAVGWAWGLNTALGVMPLHGNDVWLHLGLGIVALAAALTTHGSWRETVPRQPGPDQRGATDGGARDQQRAAPARRFGGRSDVKLEADEKLQDSYATGLAASDPTRDPYAAGPVDNGAARGDAPSTDRRVQGSR